MRRPLLIGALVSAVIALVASAAVAVSTVGGPRGQSMMGGSLMGGSLMGGSLMGGSLMGGSRMGSMGMVWLAGDGRAVSAIPAARARAATAAATAGLHPGEVIWFNNGFYVELKDAAGRPATEVIVDPRSGAVSTEPGPAMMWNTRSGMHANDSADGGIDSAKARENATSWLAANPAADRAGTTIGSVDAYPGYFTLDLRRNGRVSGMMSVNSVSGAVWYHTWHGAFIAMEDS